MESVWKILREKIPQAEISFLEKYAGAAAFLASNGEELQILYASETYLKELAYEEELQTHGFGSHPCAYMEANSKDVFLETVHRAIDTKEEQECETWGNTFSKCCGENKICIRNTVKVVGQEQDAFLLFTRIQDITAEKKQYLEVSESETRFRAAAEQINVYAWEYELATKEMRPCYRCMRDLGLPAVVRNYPEPAIEMGIFPQDYADFYRDWHRQIHEGVEYLEAIIPLTVGRVPFKVRYSTEFDENGKPYKAYGSATLVQEGEEEAEENREIISTISQQYQLLFKVDLELDQVKAIKVDNNHVIADQLEGQLEFSYKEACEKYINASVHPDDREMMLKACESALVREKLRENKPYHLTYRIFRDGETHYYQVKFFHLRGKKTVLMAFLNVDAMIEKERENEKALETALDSAKRANAAKTTFLSHISHDIRTPLNGIIGLLEMDERHAEDHEMIEDNRKKIKVAADHLLSLINDVLSLSKIEDNNVVLAHDPFDLLELEKDVMTIAKMRADDAGIVLEAEHKQLEHAAVYGSPLHLRQVILNLLGNSIKYNKSGGKVTYSSDFTVKNEKELLYTFIIEDTGIGMSQEFLTRIFEPFSQEKQDERSVYQGTGLGMSIVKSLIDKMNGTIDIQSTENVGSTFKISIPFERAATEDLPKADGEQKAQVDLTNRRILLVEDNKINRFIAKKLLEDKGAAVEIAVNGLEAVELMEQAKGAAYDVILMDVMMPVMDGLTATRQIRQQNQELSRQIPIVAMTANAFEEDKQTALEAGMNGYVSKPLNTNELLTTLGDVLR